MKCAIHQPQFLPWLGHFAKINMADVFVFLDTVQFQKNEYQNRNRIRTATGWQWITVPVSHTLGDQILQVRIATSLDWRRRVWGRIQHSYARTECFATQASGLRDLLDGEWDLLKDVNIATVKWLMHEFGIATPTVLASELPACRTERTARLVDICRHVGAATYVSGSLARRYLDVRQFERAGLEVEFQDYVHPVYTQRGHDDFVSHLSAIDGLFNCGGGRTGREKLNLQSGDR